MKTPTSSPGRALAAMRKTHAGGRPSIPTPCRSCRAICPSARAARIHCAKATSAAPAPAAEAK